MPVLSHRWVLAVCLFLVMTSAALADKRVALVVGNSAYQKVGQLPNPAHDAGAIGALFKVMAFDVVEAKFDLGVADLRHALRDFTDQVHDADIAVVYYAGHGMEVNGVNYLIPVDAKLERDIDIEDEAVSLDRVLRTIEEAKRLRLVILDACRDNPLTRSMKRSASTRSIGRGLAKIEDLTSDTLVAYAARAGSFADDGAGENSPYTAALIKYLPLPALDLRLALGRVRDEVLRTTNKRQEPFVYGSLGGAEIALAREDKSDAQKVAVPVAPLQRENPAEPTDVGKVMRFDQSIPFAQPEISNRSLKQLLTDIVPLHAPIGGLPEQLWKQGCSACHNWDQTTLCAQGNVYVKDPKMISRLPHPFGMPFKFAVMDWAKNGCK
jgi:caspase domain-containing protein